METSLNWHGFATSIPGGGHILYGIPCQDASLTVTTPRAAVIVCDGRGSAKLSHFGAQCAVDAFRRQIAILDPFIAGLLDGEEKKDEAWLRFCRIMYRTLYRAQIDLAAEYAQPEKEFDFTVAFAITGKCYIGCFQVGDGAIVLRQQGKCITAFTPEKGEFANQTHFLRPDGEIRGKFQCALFPATENSGIAVTSDGPEHLMFHLSNMTPGKIFDCFFDDLAVGRLQKHDVMNYLTRPDWNKDPRGADDRSIALLVHPVSAESAPEKQWEEKHLVKEPEVPVTIPSQEPRLTSTPESGKMIVRNPFRWVMTATVFLFAAMIFGITYLFAENRNLHAVIAEKDAMQRAKVVDQAPPLPRDEKSPAVPAPISHSAVSETEKIADPAANTKKSAVPEKTAKETAAPVPKTEKIQPASPEKR